MDIIKEFATLKQNHTHIIAFYEFLKGTHKKASSNIKFLPKDVLEIIWKQYVLQNVSYVELIKFGFTNLKEQHISAFYEFLKVTHPKAQSDLKYIPRDVLEIILTEYVFKSFDHIEMIKFGLNTFFYKKMFSEPNLLSEKYIQGSVMACITHGNVEVLKWLFDETKKRNVKIKSRHLIDVAAKYGQLDVIKILHENQESSSAEEVCTIDAMNWASFFGSLDIVQFLHNNRPEGCTTYAMDFAALSGHLHVVEWLHENRTEGCSHKAMDWAASAGHLHVVEWLHVNRTEGCTTWAMNSAAANGHLHVIEWLFENRTEGCTANAMNLAAKSGHLHVVIWLQTWSEKEGHITFDLDESIRLAAMNGHFHVVKWLRPHQRQKKYNIFCPPFCMFL